MKRWIVVSLTLLLSLALVACNTEEAEVPQSREDYELEMEIRLDDLNQQIEALKTEAEQMIGEELTAEDIDQAIAELEAQAEATAQELEELSAASAEAWEDFKPGLEAALEELEKAYQEARTNFEES